MSKKKILHITSTKLYWGSEKSFILLVRKVRDKYNNYVLTVNGPIIKDLTNYKIPYGLYNEVGLTKALMIKFLKFTYNLSRFIKQNQFNLIHANDLNSSQFSILAAKLANIKSVVHIRDPYLSKNLKWMNVIILNMANRIIAISKDVKKELIKKGIYDKKISVVYNAIELSKENNIDYNFKTKLRQEILGYKEDHLIGICGRIAPVKGHDYFFRAVPDILKKFESTRVLVVGEDPSEKKDFLRKIMKIAFDLKINDNISFLGFRNDMQTIMKCLDILIVPSLAEPFGRVVIEGMAAKTPIIATSVGGIPEIIDNGINGILIPPMDERAIATAAIDLLSNRSYAMELVKNAEKKVEENFLVEIQLSKIEKIYNKLIA